MIRVFQVEKNSCRETSLEDMDYHKKKWVDCFQPSKEELRKIAKVIEIPLYELELALDEFERPKCYSVEHFSVIFLKVPIVHKRGIGIISMSFIVSENLVLTMRLAEDATMKKLLNVSEEKTCEMVQKGGIFFFLSCLHRIVDEFFIQLDDIEDTIDDLEDEVFEKISPRTVRKIFQIKKSLIFFHKGLLGNRDVMNSLDSLSFKMSKLDQKFVKKAYDDFVQLLDMVTTYRDILTGSLDIYLTNVSNNLNIVMKRMTALGSIVLVPTFITGLYGMNFIFMPELQWKYGYLFAWGLIIGSIVFMFTYFKRKGWLT